MLSRKQHWRRTRERIPKLLRCGGSSTSSSFHNEHDMDDREQIPTKDTPRSRTTASTNIPSPATTRLKSALSSSNLFSINERARRRDRDRRSLRFSSTVHVLLIPSRLELLSSFDNIYWLHEDYAFFKRDAVKEIREAARVYSIPPKAAMTLLYQPEPEPEPQGDNDVDEAEGIMYEEDQHAYDYYVSDYATNFDYSHQNVSIDYQYHCNNHPAPMARKDSNYLLVQESSPYASPHSVTTIASPKTLRDLKFITNVKTDVELNAVKSSSSSGGGSSHHSSSSSSSSGKAGGGSGGQSRTTPHQPRRTTTSAPQKQHAWAVQWKQPTMT